MKKSLFAFVAIAAAVLVALVGCETEKLTDTQLSISPAKATIAPGESLVLTAQGGWDYTWELEPETGTLSPRNGKKVTYYAPTLADEATGMHDTVKVKVNSGSISNAYAVITIHADAKDTDGTQSASNNSSSNSSSTNPED